MPPHLLTNFKIQQYYRNEPRFNGVFSRNNLPKIKDEAYIINLDKYKSVRTHWIALYMNGDDVGASNDPAYFESFGVEYIPKEIKTFIGNRNITTNNFGVQANFCIGFIDFMLKGKSFLEYQFNNTN